jgi:hypothetical protein
MAQNAPAMRRQTLAVRIFSSIFMLLPLLSSPMARAEQSLIKSPGDHPSYRFEAEPHGLIGFGGPFRGGRGDFGAGFRGTVIVLDNGFIKSINNSVGITFGADIFFRGATVLLPVGMQWNFWLSNHWSVFGEPGIAIAANRDRGRDLLHPSIWVGGRYHFTDRFALTMRLGYPDFSLGVSFFL